MARRLQLQTILELIIDNENVYFQPPESIKLNYPCIIYELSGHKSEFADNKLYLNKKQYTITVIDRDPDSLIPDKLLSLSLISFDRYYAANNLNHYVFRLYF